MGRKLLIGYANIKYHNFPACMGVTEF